MKTKDELINALVVKLADETNMSIKDLRQAISMELFNYSINEIDTTELTTTNGNTTNALFQYFAVGKLSSNKSQETLKQYRLVVNQLCDMLNKELNMITTEDVNYFLVMYKQIYNVSDCTMENKRLCLSSIFGYLYNHKKIDDNPMLRIEPVGYTSKVKTPLSDEEIERIKIACELQSGKKGRRNYAIINFFLDTGVRVSELCNIKLKDVDFEKRRCKVLGKGNKERYVYFTGGCKIRMIEYLKDRNDIVFNGYDMDYNLDTKLFTSLNYKHHDLHKSGIECMLKQIGKESGVLRLHPHLLRATFASKLAKKGVDINIIAKLLGHANLNTIGRYVILLEDDIKKVIG
jgi:site-specific recombinase XerD